MSIISNCDLVHRNGEMKTKLVNKFSVPEKFIPYLQAAETKIVGACYQIFQRNDKVRHQQVLC